VARPPKTRTFHESGRTLTLHDRGTHHELMIGAVPILTSALLGTERAFGALAGRFATRAAPRILIGGLGFGATLAGALEVLSAEAEVIVVERLATVVRLVRRELGHLAEGALDDPRVRLVRADVAAVIERERDLDAILLDVDNGPDWASFEDNARLYDDEGLERARRALASGGAYAVWSGYEADRFLPRLSAAGFSPSVVTFEEKGRIQARAYVGHASAER
jgi:spermidine synthase